jgi:hypothetical protein
MLHITQALFCTATASDEAVGAKPVKEKFFPRWIQDATKRVYERANFLPPPMECPPNTYNTYMGLAASKLPENAEARDLSLMFEHMRLLAGDTGEKGASYLTNYIAHLVQRPGSIPRVGLLMQSVQGVGKNLFLEEFVGYKILGRQLCVSSANSDVFFGRFDNGAAYKLLCIHDEVEGHDNAKLVSLIKESITTERIFLEEKGIKKVAVNNCARHAYFTQKVQAMHLDNPERRWMVAECDSSKAPGVAAPEAYAEYVDSLLAWIEDDRNVRAFYDFLMRRDISAWHPVNDRPKSKYYIELQRMSMSAVDEWLVSMVSDDRLPHGWRTATELRDRFVEHLKNSGSRGYKVSFYRFSKELSPYIDKGITNTKVSNSQYQFDRVKLHASLVAANKMDAISGVRN